MGRPLPIQRETPFEFEQLFFSKTDRKGIIQFGNDVFVKVSGYTRDRLIGAPHNIIRHPDMPKSVFKLFWDRLLSGQAIGAYVKNMAADGAYYWVYGYAFPIEDGYLSIRIKPSSPIFQKVQEIYSAVLKKEKSSSLEEGYEYLLQLLRENGFESYDEFMATSVIHELQSRERLAKSGNKVIAGEEPVIQKISHVTDEASQVLDANFNRISVFQQHGHSLSEKMATLDLEFRKLKHLSINMHALANRLGPDAVTLSVVAQEFSSIATQVENQLETFTHFNRNLANVIRRTSFDLAELKIQMIMVDFFVKESIREIRNDPHAFSGMLQNQSTFSELFSRSNQGLMERLVALEAELNGLEKQLEETRRLLNGMEFIKQTGAIESSRTEALQSTFAVCLHEMNRFMEVLKTSIVGMRADRKSLDQNAMAILSTTQQIKGNIDEVFRLALLLS